MQLSLLFEGFRLVNAKKESSKVNVYPQNLPIKKEIKDTSHFPFILVSLEEINIENQNTDEENLIYLVFGNHDANENRQGYKDIINMITKVKDYLISTHLICGKYELGYPVRCVFQKEDTFPVYYGGMELRFKLPCTGANQHIEEKYFDFNNANIENTFNISGKVEDYT
jgi:hypothetical protein